MNTQKAQKIVRQVALDRAARRAAMPIPMDAQRAHLTTKKDKARRWRLQQWKCGL